MDNILIRLLERSKLTKELLEFWQYGNTENFWCGYVIDYNETLVSIQHYSKYGMKDGILIWPIDKIQNIDFQNDYIFCLQHIIEQVNDQSGYPIHFNLPNHDEWQFDMLVQLEGDQAFLTSTELNGGSLFTGFIEDVTEEDFVIACIGYTGNSEGKSLYKVNEITGFHLDDMDNQKRFKLYHWKK
ncbi:hypothetical protein [Fluviicola sp.]|uniref:hypothetical protein n=1 Tax=Fluviicola sp. TaxID=1917219 RepID=UPI0031DDD2B2